MRANDNELLRRYLRDRSEVAFAELVERYLGLVYSAALRQVDGDTLTAEDVTQAVFIDLARKGGHLLRHPTLAGWLYTSTRYLATNARRAALRRSAHEQSTQVMNDLLRPEGPEQDWAALRPVLDQAMHDLTPADREAVLWRYFEKHPFAEIGGRLGLSENAARMRVERALEKLRSALSKRGVTSSASALAALVTRQAIGSVPDGLGRRVCRASVAAAGGGGIAALIAAWLALARVRVALGLVTLVAILGLVVTHGPAAKTPSALPAREDLSEPTPLTAGPDTGAALGNVLQAELSPQSNTQPNFQLRLVAADTGDPVSAAEVRCSCDSASESLSEALVSDQRGAVQLGLPKAVTRLEFITHREGFADTMLIWRPDRGEPIPSESVLRLVRAVPLGGQVVDPAGSPVAGATVEGFCTTDSLWESQRETHIAEFKALTDANGRWQNQRVAPELVRSLSLRAGHPAYGPSAQVKGDADVAIESQLRQGTLVLRLGAAVIVRGSVFDPEGNPVAGAELLLGQLYTSSAKRTKATADGTFEFAGVATGKQLLTGNAEGFATTTVPLEVGPDSPPARLTLSRGKPLRLRIIDSGERPVAGAGVWINACHSEAGTQTDTLPQLRLDGKTDAEGRVLFEHVPEADLEVGVGTKGYMELCGIRMRPGGPELTLALGPELVVTGTVRDGGTGELIPRFKLTVGRPEAEGPYWSTIGRFQVSFEGGSFQHILNEAVVCEGTNCGYLLKFEAAGFAPFVSRFIAPDEPLVQLDVSLQRVSTRELTILNPDGTAAAWADVGFPELAAQNALALVPGGFARFSRSDAALQQTDEHGRVKCPQEGLSRLVAASPAGYAQVDLARQTNSAIRLQPWGRVEGILRPAGSAGGSSEVQFQYQGDRDNSGILTGFFSSYRTKPDNAGHFSFSLVPPGRHTVAELVLSSGSWTEGTTRHCRSAEVEVRPGETTQVTLESEN